MSRNAVIAISVTNLSDPKFSNEVRCQVNQQNHCILELRNICAATVWRFVTVLAAAELRTDRSMILRLLCRWFIMYKNQKPLANSFQNIIPSNNSPSSKTIQILFINISAHSYVPHSDNSNCMNITVQYESTNWVHVYNTPRNIPYMRQVGLKWLNILIWFICHKYRKHNKNIIVSFYLVWTDGDKTSLTSIWAWIVGAFWTPLPAYKPNQYFQSVRLWNGSFSGFYLSLELDFAIHSFHSLWFVFRNKHSPKTAE